MGWTELLISAPKSAPPLSSTYSVNIKFTLPAAQTLDSSLSLTSSIWSLVKSYWHNLQNVSRSIYLSPPPLLPLWSKYSSSVIQNVTIASNLSPYFYPGPLPQSFLSRASSFIFLKWKSDHVTPSQILKLLPFSLTGKAKASLASLTSSPFFALPSLSPGVLEYTIQAPPQSLCSLLSLECMCAMRLPSCFSRVQLFTTPWTIARLLCPWESPGKNTGVGCHALLQGIFPTQGSNLLSNVSWSGRWVFTTWEVPRMLFHKWSHDLITSIECLSIENCHLTDTKTILFPSCPFKIFLYHIYHLKC